MHYFLQNPSVKAIVQRLPLFLIMVALCAIQACSSTSKLPPAQTTNDFFQKYRNESGFKGTTLPVGLVTRYLLPRSGSDTTLKAALSNITSIRVLTFTPTTRQEERLLDRGLTQELDQVLTKENYENLPMAIDNPGALQFRMRATNEQVQEIVGYRKHGNSFLMLQINGRFTRQQVEQMLQKIDPEVFFPLLGS